MADSTRAQTDSLRSTLDSMFGVERNGVALGQGLVTVIVTYLVETLLVRSASEIDIDEARSL